MSSNFAALNKLVNWQVAPAEHEIAHYDQPKIEYRQYVEEMINSIPLKSLKKKAFFTISTNVLCADIDSSKDTIDPIDRDIYLPLEISITKLKLLDWTQDDKVDETTIESSLTTKVWMLHPGPPTRGNVCTAREHSQAHKIDYFLESSEQNQYVEKDNIKVLKEINSFLTTDRTVFSSGLKYIRQDLGCLKWLNREFGYKTNPIRVYSLEDLFVVLFRRILPDFAEIYSQGIARDKLMEISDTYDPELHCTYHQAKSKVSGVDCCYCARAVSFCNARKILDEIAKFSGGLDDSKGKEEKCGEATDISSSQNRIANQIVS